MRLNLAKLEGKHAFQNFDSAIAAIGPRPWLMDNLDEWLKRMRGPPHRLVNEIDTIKEGYAQCVLNTVVDKIYCRCAAIFIDNSGVGMIDRE